MAVNKSTLLIFRETDWKPELIWTEYNPVALKVEKNVSNKIMIFKQNCYFIKKIKCKSVITEFYIKAIKIINCLSYNVNL